ncbi:uncharacterized [Tachysurus ichikawai]
MGQSATPVSYFRQQAQKNEGITQSSGRGPALAHRFLGQVFRLPTRFKHHGVTFLSSVRVGGPVGSLRGRIVAVP